jgi:hypothetical protein
LSRIMSLDAFQRVLLLFHSSVRLERPSQVHSVASTPCCSLWYCLRRSSTIWRKIVNKSPFPFQKLISYYIMDYEMTSLGLWVFWNTTNSSTWPMMVAVSCRLLRIPR